VKRVLACSLAAAAVGTAFGAATGLAAHGRTDAAVEVRAGDRIEVAGAPIGCRVARMPQLGGRVVVDCRRAGALKGSYGTLLTGREALLVRFESSRTAKRVAVGIHERRVKRCR
jgi:hypothetical protein